MEYQINKLHRDEFGRPSGIIAVDKPAGVTSHDIVYQARKALHTAKVGHAGALDPFASGLLIILVGKATTQSDSYLNLGKEYLATVLFGISTDSADPEGQVLDAKHQEVIGLVETLQKFVPSYQQFVPVFSSVKVDGEKLRVLARKADRFETYFQDGLKYVRFFKGDTTKEIALPVHQCDIPYAEIISQSEINISASEFYATNADRLNQQSTYPIAEIKVGCSKGTYIRVMAEDIGQNLPQPLPAMLWQLRRTRIGDTTLQDSIQPDNLGAL